MLLIHHFRNPFGTLKCQNIVNQYPKYFTKRTSRERGFLLLNQIGIHYSIIKSIFFRKKQFSSSRDGEEPKYNLDEPLTFEKAAN
jgi:hypothetical protein